MKFDGRVAGIISHADYVRQLEIIQASLKASTKVCPTDFSSAMTKEIKALAMRKARHEKIEWDRLPLGEAVTRKGHFKARGEILKKELRHIEATIKADDAPEDEDDGKIPAHRDPEFLRAVMSASGSELSELAREIGKMRGVDEDDYRLRVRLRSYLIDDRWEGKKPEPEFDSIVEELKGL